MTDQNQPLWRPAQPEPESTEPNPVNAGDEPSEPTFDTAAVDAAVARSAAPDIAGIEVFDEVTMSEETVVTETESGVTSSTVETVTVTEVVAEPTITPTDAAAAPGFDTAGPAPVYVPAPLPPRMRSNRWFATLIALIGAGTFAVLDAGLVYIGMSMTGTARAFVSFLESPVFWGSTVVFFALYALFGVLVNRGPLWVHAVFSWFIALLMYVAVIALMMVDVQAWTLTGSQAVERLQLALVSPFPILAAVLTREIPIWFGSWISRNGRKVTARNDAAMDAYERELAAGPLFP